MPKNALDLLEGDKRRSLVAAGLSFIEKRGAQFSSFNEPERWPMNSLTLGTKSGAAVNYLTALTVSTVYACTQIISGTIGRLPCKLYQRTAAGRNVITDHPAVRLLSISPDGVRTAFAWRQMMEAAALLRGNGFSRIKRNKFFEVEALEWLDPFTMEFWRTPDGYPFYRYRGEVLHTYDVLHHREMSLDGVIGLSPITCMREQVGLAISTQEHGSRFFSNGAAPALIFTAPLTATKEQMDRIREEITKNHGGVANSSKPFVAYGGLTASPVQISNQDAQFLESRKFDVEELARAFRVPLHLLQSTEKTTSWGTGVESLNRAFFDYSLADRLERWEQELNLSLLSVEEQNAGYYFAFDLHDLLSGSAKDRIAYYIGMRTICAMDVNEIRERENLNDLPDNIGNNFQLPFNSASGQPEPDGEEEEGSGNADTKKKAAA